MNSFVNEFRNEQPQKKRGLTITLSGLAGSGKTSVGEAISEKFGLKHVTVGEIFRGMAKERKLSLEDFLKTVTAEEDREADKRTLQLAMKGGVVIDSRLSGWIAGGFADFRIFISPSLEERARRVSGRDNMNYEEALKKVSQRDECDIGRYKKLYNVDLRDLSVYHLVLDNTKFSKNETASIVNSILGKAFKK